MVVVVLVVRAHTHTIHSSIRATKQRSIHRWAARGAGAHEKDRNRKKERKGDEIKEQQQQQQQLWDLLPTALRR